MTRRHLPSPKSSLRMFARLDERGIDDAMAFSRGAGSWSTQVAEAVDGDTFIEIGTSQNTPRHQYSAALGRRGLLMEPTRTNIVPNQNFVDVAPNNNVPDGWTNAFGAAGVNFQCVGNAPHGGTAYRNVDSSGHFQLVAVPGASDIACSVWVRRVTAAGAFSILSVDVPPGTPTIALGAAVHDWRRFTSQETTIGAGAAVYFLYRQAGSDEVILALPQAEVGKYPTSFIPGAARAAELCAIDSALIASDGVLEIEYVPQFGSTAFATSDTIWTWANGWRLDYDGSDDAIHLIVNGNSEIESAALAFSADTKFELQVRWGSWGTQLGVNGVVLKDGTAWGTPTPAAYLGSGAASAQCEAKIFGDVRIAR